VSPGFHLSAAGYDGLVRIITWNVNSIRSRLPRVLALLERHRPDALLVQETKVTDAGFPAAELMAAGYHSAVFGQSTYNGVAIASRRPLEDVRLGFPDDPLVGEARVISGRLDGITLIDAYVVNGRAVTDPMYEQKLRWLDAFTNWITARFSPADPVLLAGDFNIAPDDRDVHDPVAYRDRVHASEPERRRLKTLFEWGLVDLLREITDAPGIHSWWDYRGGAFHRGRGLRIDLMLGTAPLAARVVDVGIDRDERKPSFGEGKPSDHAPVIAEFG
jgi:exodeoxyribonuclease-3